MDLLKIEYTAPPEVEASFHGVLKNYLLLFPLWLQRLHINFNPKVDGAFMITIMDDYCQACIEIGDDWLKCGPDEREQMIVHEIVHVLTVPLKRAAEDWMEDFEIEDNVKKAYIRNVTRVMERVTQDFAYSIHRWHSTR